MHLRGEAERRPLGEGHRAVAVRDDLDVGARLVRVRVRVRVRDRVGVRVRATGAGTGMARV